VVRLRLRGEVIEVLSIKPRNYVRFLNVKQGTAATQIVNITGEEDRPVEITNLNSTLDYIKPVLKDGEKPWMKTLEITLTEDAPAGNLNRGRITFRTNYKERPAAYIAVAGTVQGPIRFSPVQANFGDLARKPDSDDHKTWVMFWTSEDEEFEITGAETSIPRFVTVEVKPLVPGKKYRVNLTYTGNGKPPVLNGRLTVSTSMKGQPTIEVPIRGTFTRAHKRAEPPARAKAGGAPKPVTGGKPGTTDK
jgi:hypothetical protein